MVERAQVAPSVRRQCELLGIARSGINYTAKSPDDEELGIMRRIDEIHLEKPCFGSRMMAVTLRNEGRPVNRKRAQRLMRAMGIESLAPKPSTSAPHPEHTKYPYLLRGMKVFRANQVWASDITYIPMRHGFVYLVCVMDWFSRRVLAWRLSTTMDTAFCVEALIEALERYGSPQIFNTDQGSQFTSEDFTSELRKRKIAVSMDGKGRFLDNVFVERLWRSLKYEEVYLHAYDTPKVAREAIGRYLNYYNVARPHQALGYRTPTVVFEHSVAIQTNAKPGIAKVNIRQAEHVQAPAKTTTYPRRAAAA